MQSQSENTNVPSEESSLISTIKLMSRIFIYLSYLVGATVLCFIGMEIVSCFLLYVKGSPADVIDERAFSSVYSDLEEAKDYYKELTNLRVRFNSSRGMVYSPYEIWHNRDFAGKYINIKDGKRIPLHNPCVSYKSKKIFFFGGSTMWGDGVPDSHTIPSLVAKELANNPTQKLDYCVTNYAERAYCLYQEFIRLTKILEKGEKPDIAIFLDGLNEGGTAFQSGRAGLHYDVAEITERLGRMSGANLVSLRWLLRSTNTCQVAGAIKNSLFTQPKKQSLAIKQQKILAHEVCDSYQVTKLHIELLARKYGFKTLFIWQPYLSPQLKRVSKEENLVLLKGTYQKCLEFIKLVYSEMQQRIETLSIRGVHDLSRVFIDNEKTLYVDPMHLGPEGNSFIAREITRLIMEMDG